jgi:dihydrofolate reductase
MKPFQAIAAMAENRVIGQGNQIPWHLPEDFRWFKQKTMGQVLVMGRLTYQSIGRALPGRQTLIMSRSGFEAEGLLTLDSVDALLAWSKDQERTLFICGGALLYAQLLEHCSDLFLSRVRGKPLGDAFFPPFEHLFDSGQVLLEAPEFSVTHHRALVP